MKFIADFHIHSKHSRATASSLDLENLYISAQLKGITVIGTGDFTHPQWWHEITTKLIPAEQGLYKLKPDIAAFCNRQVPDSCRSAVRFMLVTEISNIYKKGDRTRKNHNLVFLPDFESAATFNKRLDAIGNIQSDGRPILGLDARNLLEIVLETHDDGYLIPAHVWTPWFSLLGSKSGFDSVEECFDDLSDYIFALETGLSSDPPMNRRVSALDRYTLISNSDAHSPSKLGREANCFDAGLNYHAIHDALRSGDARRFRGTIEFYPEEGKYHIDGHRKCDFSCQPEETRRLSGVCPQCGKPLTRGVLHRVEDLADRANDEIGQYGIPFSSMIPLVDILSDLLEVGPNTKTVNRAYTQLIQRMGPEFHILRDAPIEDLNCSPLPLLPEAIKRMRTGQLFFEPGYDGVFGRVRLFNPEERKQLHAQLRLFDCPQTQRKSKGCSDTVSHDDHRNEQKGDTDGDSLIQRSDASRDDVLGELHLNAAQRAVVEYGNGAMIISAGPGTGKTRTITCRIADLLMKRACSAKSILAVTFTNQAASEMHHRLREMVPAPQRLPTMTTFHGYCFALLKTVYEEETGHIIDDQSRNALISDAISMASEDGSAISLSHHEIRDGIVQAKQQMRDPSTISENASDPLPRDPIMRVYQIYQNLLKIQNLYDYEDLIFLVVSLLEDDADLLATVRQGCRFLFVDEFQDINYAQYRLIRAIAPKGSNICVIGDPDQAIYGFRGSDPRYFTQYKTDYPDHAAFGLMRNYRSTETILNASRQALGISNTNTDASRPVIFSGIDGYPSITLIETDSARAEAVAVGRTIEQMVGGTGFHSVDFGTIENGGNRDHSFSDFAVLCRTGRQARKMFEIITTAGIPCLLASKQEQQDKDIQALLAAFKVVTGTGTYAELDHVTDLISPGISRQTIAHFKQWAYGKQLVLSTALRSTRRIPIPGLSHRRQTRLTSLVDRLERLSSQTAHMRAAEALVHIATQTTLSNRVKKEQLDAWIQRAEQKGGHLESFANAVAMQEDTDLYHPNAQRVAVMTMHASKGLEFNVVFITGCEAGLIPYQPADGRADNTEEERRLFYVAMTRARQRLFCTRAIRRTMYGKHIRTQPSPFFDAVEPSLVRCVKAFKYKTRKQQRQLELF